MIETVLKYHLPNYWDSTTSYEGRYELININESESDYGAATLQFGDLDILEVQRLQNPYMYGRYKLGKEKLRIIKPDHIEKKMYHPIAQSDIKQVAEYNCDCRRYSTAYSAQRSGKNPLFYSTPLEAKNQFPGPNVCIVVVNVMTSPYSASTATNDRDSEYYPEYFVLLK